MSGRDERPNIDILECPKCGGIPHFWILNIDVAKWIWLFSEDYLKRFPTFKKVTPYRCNPIELEDVHMIKCRGRAHSLRSAGSHSFSKGDDNFAETFQAIIKQTKYYIDVGRVRDY